MRTLAAILLTCNALTASAKWVACETVCPPPIGAVSGISSLPLYKGNVKFGGEVKDGGTVRWTWVRVDQPPACTPAQLANLQDRAYGCGAKVGEVLLRTERIRNVP